MRNLVRNLRGTMIHRADCPKMGPFPKPWLWANDKTDAQIHTEVMIHHYHVCRVCKPLPPFRVGGDDVGHA